MWKLMVTGIVARGGIGAASACRECGRDAGIASSCGGFGPGCLGFGPGARPPAADLAPPSPKADKPA